MSYVDSLDKIGNRTARAVLTLWARVPDQLSVDAFTPAAARIIARANGQAWNVALAAVAVWVRANTNPRGTPIAAPVDPHHTSIDRLATGLGTTIAGADIARRLERMARAEPIEAGHRGYSAAIDADDSIRGWERDTRGDACDLCADWAAYGELPAHLPMLTHTACLCSQRPVPA